MNIVRRHLLDHSAAEGPSRNSVVTQHLQYLTKAHGHRKIISDHFNITDMPNLSQNTTELEDEPSNISALFHDQHAPESHIAAQHVIISFLDIL